MKIRLKITLGIIIFIILTIQRTQYKIKATDIKETITETKIQINYFPQRPASYIIWWPSFSSDNTSLAINQEMNRLVNTYHPEYLILHLGWYDLQKKDNEYVFDLNGNTKGEKEGNIFKLIAEKARDFNLKLIIFLGLDAYQGIGMYPFSYTSSDSWFWKKYNPLTHAMRHPPTCGCNCGPTPNPIFYNKKDFSVLKGNLNSLHLVSTCDNLEIIPYPTPQTIGVNEHPDLVYSAFDTFFPGNTNPGAINFTIHTPYPSFSSDAYKTEVKKIWSNFASYVKKYYSSLVKGYQIWHEPQYAGFRESMIDDPNINVGYEVDYSPVEFQKYNEWRQTNNKSVVKGIHNPPDNDYKEFRRFNLANFMKEIKDEIKKVDPNIPVGIQLFIAGEGNDIFRKRAEKLVIDSRARKIMYNTFLPDFISEYALTGTNFEGEADYKDGQTVREKFQIIKTTNIRGVPLISSGIDLYKEVREFNSILYPAVKIVYLGNPNVPGGQIPLMPAWQKQVVNNLHTENELASVYTNSYSWDLNSTISPALKNQMFTNETINYTIWVTNTSNRVWNLSGVTNPINLGSRWFDSNGQEALDEQGLPLNTRAILGTKRRVLPGEQYKFVLPIKAPNKPGSYKLTIDMVEEGRTWFAWQGSKTINVAINVLPSYNYKFISIPYISDVMTTGPQSYLQFSIKNIGNISWNPAKIRLAARWLYTNGQPVMENNSWLHFRAKLLDSKSSILPNDIVNYRFDDLRTPKTPGEYVLQIDMVEEGVAWFQSFGALPLNKQIKVVFKPSYSPIPSLPKQ